MEKNKCQPQNYNCGRICIKGAYVCHVDGLTGQSVSLSQKLKILIHLTNFTNKEELGHGAFGTVFTNGKGLAYKVEDFKSYDEKYNNNKFAKRKTEEQRFHEYLDKKRRRANINNLVAKEGYAPIIEDIYTLPNRKVVTIMEELEGYENLIEIGLNNWPDISELRKIKEILKEKKILHKDLKMDNIMYNSNTGDIKLVDFDIAKIDPNMTDKKSDRDWILIRGVVDK